MKKSTKKEIETEIKAIFNKHRITKKDMQKSRALTKKFVKETNYKTND